MQERAVLATSGLVNTSYICNGVLGPVVARLNGRSPGTIAAPNRLEAGLLLSLSVSLSLSLTLSLSL